MDGIRRLFMFCFILLVAIGFLATLSPTQVSAQKVELSLANEAPPFFVYTIVSEKFKEVLEKKAGDKVSVKIFHSGQLGGEKDTIEGEIIGNVDMAIVQSSLLALWEPQMVYIDIPFLYRDIDHAINVMNGPIGQSINSEGADEHAKGTGMSCCNGITWRESCRMFS